MALKLIDMMKALEVLRPGEKWHTDPVDAGNEADAYQYLVWDDTTTKPTEAELDTAWATESVREARRLAYSKIGDQLDQVYKTLKYLKDNGTVIGPDGDAWVAEIDSIKTANPLP